MLKSHVSWMIAIAIVLVGLLCHNQGQSEAIGDTEKAEILFSKDI